MDSGFSRALFPRLRGVLAATIALAAVAGLRAQSGLTSSTLAGVSPGNVDGQGTAARFRGGGGAAVDGSGNIYIADTYNDTIRKVTPAGSVTTLAGSPGVIGTVDGTGSAAEFNEPAGIAVDSTGNIYVADYEDNTVRKVTQAGVVTTLAGSPSHKGPVAESADGTGASAGFFHPEGVAVDGQGNIYVADSGNGTIRKITPGGAVSTLAGLVGITGTKDGTGTTALFILPTGLAIDGSGNLYTCDTAAKTIRKITPTGTVTTLAGSPNVSGNSDGTGSAATFSLPIYLAADASGNVYVSENEYNTIRKITPAGVVTTLAGSTTVTGSINGTGSAAAFQEPYGVAVDGSGNVYVSDDTTLRVVTPSGVVSTLAGIESIGSADGATLAGHFFGPIGMAVDGGGNAYVADTNNDTVRKVSPFGAVTTLAGSAGNSGSSDGAGAAASFNSPNGVAVDGSGNVYVADTENSTIRKITPAGTVSTLAGLAGNPGSSDGAGSTARFRIPIGAAVDTAGNVYVSDSGNYTIRKITPAGTVTTLAGSAGVSGNANGTGGAASFGGLGGLALDASGNIYVADETSIRKVTAGGSVSTFAGTPGVSGSADGTGSSATFGAINAVAADGNGNIFVTDQDTVREVTSAGVVTTVAGIAGVVGSADGTGQAARFDFPNGIASFTGGILLVADTGNNSVRQLTTAVISPGTPVSSGNAWLTNLSARAFIQGTGNLEIAGFVTTGPASKSLLVRADGPALVNYGISGFLADPQLSIYNGQAVVAQNSAWPQSLVGTFTQLGAFPLAAGSHDDALVQSVTPGGYTAQISSQSGGSGIVLAEIYDADSTAPTNRLINISARAPVSAAPNLLVGGFVVAGTTDELLLIRAIGPALAVAPFNLTGTLASPVLTVLNSSGAVIATNQGWGSAVAVGPAAVFSGSAAMSIQQATSAIMSQVGAFSIAAGSADCAMVIALPPGPYTAQVSGANGSTGVGLVEIYEIQ
jgi:sugar lactone lactonase YvrE